MKLLVGNAACFVDSMSTQRFFFKANSASLRAYVYRKSQWETAIICIFANAVNLTVLISEHGIMLSQGHIYIHSV